MISFKNPMKVTLRNKNKSTDNGSQFIFGEVYQAYGVDSNENLLILDRDSQLHFLSIHKVKVIDDGFSKPKWYDESIKQLINAVSTIQSAISDKSVADNSTNSGLLETNKAGTKKGRASSTGSTGTDVPTEEGSNTEFVGNIVDSNKISSTVAGINL